MLQELDKVMDITVCLGLGIHSLYITDWEETVTEGILGGKVAQTHI